MVVLTKSVIDRSNVKTSNETTVNNQENNIHLISPETKELLNSINYEKEIGLNELTIIVNNYEAWRKTASIEQQEKISNQILDRQEGHNSEHLKILLKYLRNPEYQFTAEEQEILRQNPEILEQLNIDNSTLRSTDSGKALEEVQYMSLALEKQVEMILKEKKSFTKADLEDILSNNPDFRKYADLLGLYAEKYVEKENEIYARRQENIQIESGESRSKEKEIVEMQAECELIIGDMLDLAPDFALTKLDNIEPEFTDIKEQILESDKDTPEYVELPEEQYEAPSFKVQEKKGLAKFFNNIVKAFQNRNAKRLDAPQEQRKPEGVSTSKLEPVIPEANPVKRTTNRFMENFLGLFRKDSKDNKPVQTIEPVNPNNSWEVSQDVKDSIVSVGQAAGQKTDKIIPKAIDGKTSDEPSFDDNL